MNKDMIKLVASLGGVAPTLGAMCSSFNLDLNILNSR